MKANTKGLEKFQENLKKLNKQQTSQFTEKALKELAARLLKRVIHRTPVKSGHLRRAWTVGEVTREGDAFTVEIVNNVEYAPYVEFGHRTPNHTGWVDGRFMLTISEIELQRDAPQLLMNKLNKFIKDISNS
jgi:HK97 gp10 family phage protein